MKKFLVFILVLASKLAFSCGFYPYGEDTRFCFFNPNHFNYRKFSEFNYSANSFTYSYEGIYDENEIDENEKLWISFCKNKVDLKDIQDYLYNLPLNGINESSTNKMVQYFYKTKNFEALEYLKFTKKCEIFTMPNETDPWEQNQDITLQEKNDLINQAFKVLKTVKNKEIKSRYAFVTIRLAFYSNNKSVIKHLFDSEFKNTKNKNVLYYWSLYFKTLVEENKSLSSFYATQVFANSPDKRFSVYNHFDSKISIDKVLKYAKTNQEILNVKLFYAIRKSDKSLNYMKEIYQLNPKSEGLSFLLLREVNKIEDWVLTPHYTLFEPSIRKESWYNDGEISISSIINRSESDRKYAKEVINFIDNCDLSKVENPVFWKTAKAHLLFITRDFSESLSVIKNLEKIVSKKDSLFNQIKIMKALNLTANQVRGNAIILNEVKPIILEFKNNKQFLFAIGRELENLDNTSDAAFLYSNLEANEYGSGVYWKTKKHRRGSYSDYFYNYFGYLDVIYTPNQLQNIIDETEKNRKKSDEFSIWKYNIIENNLSELYELLGTKYIRQDNLQKAAQVFRELGNDYWVCYYDCLWEREQSDGLIFDQNPFSQLINTPDFETNEKGFVLNKLSVTEKLIEYLAKANNPNEKNRDYYYFLVANCYYNMTINGNSWMLRRYGISDNDVEPFPEDHLEFQNSDLSKKYYMLAYKNAKTDKFKALCLMLAKNYKKLKLEQEYEYFNLSGNCSIFNEYFQSRI